MEEQKEIIEYDKTKSYDGNYFLVDRDFLLGFLQMANINQDERNQAVSHLTDASNDMLRIRQVIAFLDKQLGLEKIMSGKMTSPFAIAGKLIATINDMRGNPDKYKIVGTEVNDILNKVTNDNYILNKMGKQLGAERSQRAIGAGKENGGTDSGGYDEYQELKEPTPATSGYDGLKARRRDF